MKKMLSSVIAIVMILTLLVSGCSTPKENANTESAQEATAETAAAEETAAEEPTTTEETPTEANAETPSGDFAVGLVTDIGGINDQSFNQSAWEGMQKLEKELGYKISFLESAQEADFSSNLDKLSDEDLNLIWGIGFLMTDAMKNAATMNPDQQYGIIDSSIEDQPDNLASVLFKAQESCFLVGYIAGRMTKTDHVGLVGPIRNPIIDQFEFGFRGGVAYAAKEMGKEITVDVQYCESFSDDAKAKAIATVMYSEDADIVFAMAGGAGLGVIEAAKEMNKYVIGVDRDQNYLAPDNVLTSAIKKVDQVIFDVTKEAANGNFKGGEGVYYGLAEGAVGIAPTSDKLVPADILAATDEVKAKIIDGTIIAPDSEQALNDMIAKF